MIAGWNFKTTEILKVKIKNLSNWFVLLVCRTLHVSQLLLHGVCQVSAKIYEHGHGPGSSHGGHCRCVKGCQVHTLLFFQQQPYFQIGGTLFSGLQHFALLNPQCLTAVHRDCCALSHPLGRRYLLLFAHHRSCHQKGFSSTLFFGFS